ncbi:MAG: hypothetical protein JKY51_00700 [Opitutaceae bacterium]|nr:hypothetical protein [Opitutaceae bacterium]
METKITCPLGSECESANNGVLYRCAWFTEVTGTNPNTGEPIQEWRCAMSWLPLLQIENSAKVMGVNAAVSNLRDKVVGVRPVTNIFGITKTNMLENK